MVCLLDEYKELFRQCADSIEGWQDMSKNDLCRKYVENKDNPKLQNAYFSAIMYRYWYLIAKYYYMSSNVATWEDCYEWLEDSVYGCLQATSWERADSSIYKDPDGPDKVINRCMKCARLTYYQFINRKKRKDNFGLLSVEELTENFGSTISEPTSKDSIDSITVSHAIKEYIIKLFLKKDYFVAVLLDMIQEKDVFDKHDEESNKRYCLNLNKLSRFISRIDNDYIHEFAHRYNLEIEEVSIGLSYVQALKSNLIKPKIKVTLERLQHDSFFKLIHGGA